MAGIDSYTKLLLHCDGADASTTFTDSELTPKTVTPVAHAQIDTAQSKFGGASGLFDGTDDCLSLADSDDWNFGTGNFTIDFWIRFAGASILNRTDNFCAQVVNANNYFRLYYTADGTNHLLYFVHYTGGVATIICGSGDIPTMALNTWYHIAFVRNGNDFAIYLNGTSVATVTDADSFSDFAASLLIGNASVASNTFFNGWLDEYRVSKGVARWTANFTPPISAYSKEEGGAFLLNFI